MVEWKIDANLRTSLDIQNFIRFIPMHNNNRYAFIRIPLVVLNRLRIDEDVFAEYPA